MCTGLAGSVFGENLFYRETRGTRRPPQVAYLEVKVQVRDLVQIVGIATPFAPRGSIFGENLFYRETRSTRRGVSPCSSDPPGSLPRSKSTGTGPSASCGYCYPLCPAGINIRGKFILSRNPEYKTRVIAMWLKVVLTPG